MQVGLGEGYKHQSDSILIFHPRYLNNFFGFIPFIITQREAVYDLKLVWVCNALRWMHPSHCRMMNCELQTRLLVCKGGTCRHGTFINQPRDLCDVVTLHKDQALFICSTLSSAEGLFLFCLDKVSPPFML